MVDKRTKVGKAAMRERENMRARDLAAKAALARLGGGGGTASTGTMASTSEVATGKPGDEICIDDSSDDDDDGSGGNIEHGAKKDDKKYSEGSCEEEEEDGEAKDDDDDDDDDDEAIADHDQGCGCRCCNWSKMFFLSED